MQDSDQGQAGDFAETGAKLDSGVQLNLENLTKIDEKFQQLIDQLKVQKVNNISQLCFNDMLSLSLSLCFPRPSPTHTHIPPHHRAIIAP